MQPPRAMCLFVFALHCLPETFLAGWTLEPHFSGAQPSPLAKEDSINVLSLAPPQMGLFNVMAQYCNVYIEGLGHGQGGRSETRAPQ